MVGEVSNQLAAENTPEKTRAVSGEPAAVITNKTENGATHADGGRMTKAETGGQKVAAGTIRGNRNSKQWN